MLTRKMTWDWVFLHLILKMAPLSINFSFFSQCIICALCHYFKDRPKKPYLYFCYRIVFGYGPDFFLFYDVLCSAYEECELQLQNRSTLSQFRTFKNNYSAFLNYIKSDGRMNLRLKLGKSRSGKRYSLQLNH